MRQGSPAVIPLSPRAQSPRDMRSNQGTPVSSPASNLYDFEASERELLEALNQLDRAVNIHTVSPLKPASPPRSEECFVPGGGTSVHGHKNSVGASSASLSSRSCDGRQLDSEQRPSVADDDDVPPPLCAGSESDHNLPDAEPAVQEEYGPIRKPRWCDQSSDTDSEPPVVSLFSLVASQRAMEQPSSDGKLDLRDSMGEETPHRSPATKKQRPRRRKRKGKFRFSPDNEEDATAHSGASSHLQPPSVPPVLDIEQFNPQVQRLLAVVTRAYQEGRQLTPEERTSIDVGIVRVNDFVQHFAQQCNVQLEAEWPTLRRR